MPQNVPVDPALTPAVDTASTPTRTFDDLGLPARVTEALAAEGIQTPTAVQDAVIPDAMSGHDVLGRAQTGSGKTLAFGIPIVARLAGSKSRINRPRALIIVPTRELAVQVERSLRPVARAVRLKLATVYGGTRYDRQIQLLRQGTDIVVATPGRLQDLIDKGILLTEDIEVTVLDEADHLCDLGFYPAVDELLSLTPEGGQRMLLSATLDGDVDRLVKKHLRTPRLHELDPSAGAVTTMEHHVLVVGGFHDKIAAAVKLVEANPRSIVFTKTREGATELRDAFAGAGMNAVDLHGNLSQRVRERNLERFSDGRAQVVVATDVAARGIHVNGVTLVVHFDAPNDPKAYLHRSGRTARAGESGAVVTIATPRQVGTVSSLQSRAGVTSRHHDIRTAPSPMTAKALGRSGESAPAGGGPRSSGPRTSSAGGRTQSRSGGPRGRGGYVSRDDRPARGGWQERPARSESSDRPARGGWQERPARSESSDRPARGGWQERSDRPARSESSDRPARSGWQDRPARTESSDRPARSGWQDRSERPVRGAWQERSDRPARPSSSDRPVRGGWQERSERPVRGGWQDRSDRPARTESADRPARSGWQDRSSERPARPASSGRPAQDDRPQRRTGPSRPADQGKTGSKARWDRKDKAKRG